MPKVQSRLTIALLFTALALLAYFGTALLSGPIAFLYRDAAGLSTARSVAQIAALLAVAGLFLAGFVIAVPTALQESGWGRKLLMILPAYLLLFTLAGIIAMLLGVGTVGTLFNLQGVGPVTLSTAWLAVGGVLTTLALVIAAARAHLGRRVLRSAVLFTSAAGVLSVIAAVALIASVAIVSTSQPASFRFGDRGGPNQQGPSQNGNTVPGPAATPEVTSGQAAGAGVATTPEVTSAQSPGQSPATTPEVSAGSPTNQTPGSAPGGTAGQSGEGRPGGQFPPGGPGGPGGESNVASRYAIGGGLTAIFALLGFVGVIGTWLAGRGQTADAAVSTPAPAYGREIGRAVVSGAVLTVVLLGVSQIAQVPHDNPPVLTTINWDSPQTQDLARRACMDCHSNETTWPWYSYIAPSSWLTTLHVTNARQQMNLSELDNMPEFRRARLAENMANQIRSGVMPPADYLLMHPDARLTDAEKQQLIDGLQKSLSTS